MMIMNSIHVCVHFVLVIKRRLLLNVYHRCFLGLHEFATLLGYRTPNFVVFLIYPYHDDDT
jgi:hypothetical protein